MRRESAFSIFAEEYLDGFQRALTEISVSQVEVMWDMLEQARRRGRRVYVCGNGGSAVNAMAMVCDMGKGTVVKGQKRLKVSSLVAETATVTAYANDMGYEAALAEQAETFLERGDVLIVLSASGNSPNVINAARVARRCGARTIGMLGFGGGRLKSLVDLPIVVSSRNYGHAEDLQMVIQHLVTQYMKWALSQGPSRRA